jgi:hypothetical protein
VNIFKYAAGGSEPSFSICLRALLHYRVSVGYTKMDQRGRTGVSTDEHPIHVT